MANGTTSCRLTGDFDQVISERTLRRAGRSPYEESVGRREEAPLPRLLPPKRPEFLLAADELHGLVVQNDTFYGRSLSAEITVDSTPHLPDHITRPGDL